MTLYAFDVDGTLEVSEGPIKLGVLRNLIAQGHPVYIVGNYGKLSQTTLEFPNGNLFSTKESSLKILSERHPEQTQKIYIGDVETDKTSAESAGWQFVFAKDFHPV